jgi:cytochrome c peroxidase
MMRAAAIALLLFLWSCAPNQDSTTSIQIPSHFPLLALEQADYDFAASASLGKRLFFDPVLSRDSTVSCATCHLPEKAFSGGSRLSIGVEGRSGFRNAPTLVNVAYSTSFFHDGGVPSLERQVLAPFDSHDEFDLPISEAISKLKKHKGYYNSFLEVFGKEPSVNTLTTAIADFERTLIFANTPWDAYVLGDSTALNEQQLLGWQVFQSASCTTCHVPPLFTNFSFQNNGFFENFSEDPGRARVTLLTEDVGLFKVPTLRNLSLTGPYAHNGSIVVLDSIIESYNRGGSGHNNQSESIKPLGLNEIEKRALLEFLMNGLLDKNL